MIGGCGSCHSGGENQACLYTPVFTVPSPSRPVRKGSAGKRKLTQSQLMPSLHLHESNYFKETCLHS